MNNKQRKVILIFGRTGSGKSTLAKKMISGFNRVIIIDPKSEYNKGIVFYSLSDLIDFYIQNISDNDSFIFICRFRSDSEIELLFEAIEQIENLLLVLEEVEIYVSPGSRKSNFLKLVRYGRHHSISILGIARRCSELSIDFRAMVDEIYSFKQILPYDLKIMEELGLYDLDKLPDYEYKKIEY